MNVSRVNSLAGKRLKAWREKLGLSTRAVQAMSRQIASDKHNEEFFLSHNWVTDIERGRFRPGMFRMYSISVIYHRNYTEVASLFGLEIGDVCRDMASIHLPKTHLLETMGEPETEAVSLPVEFKSDFRFERTNLLARAVEKWDAVPLGLLRHLDLRTSMYGYIGLEDFTLYPLIRPGSLVQIDASCADPKTLLAANSATADTVIHPGDVLVLPRSGGTPALQPAPVYSSPAPAQAVPAYATPSVPQLQTVPYEGNGGGPTLCSDGTVSGSSGRGTCSHHGGISGGGHHHRH